MHSKFLLFRLLLIGTSTFLTISLFLFGLEFALTVKYQNMGKKDHFILPEYNSRYLAIYRPNTCIESMGGACFNNLGFRRKSETIIEKKPTIKRYVIYGDSVTFGVSVPDGSDYPAQLENFLNQPGKSEYEILNAGGHGYTPTLHTFHFRKHAPLLNSDGVIFQIELANDVSDEALVETQGVDENGFPARLITARYVVGFNGEALTGIPLRGYFFEATKAYSDLSHRFGNILSEIFPNEIFSKDAPEAFYQQGFERVLLTRERLEKGHTQLFSSLNSLFQYTQKKSMKFLVLLMPSRFVFQSSSPHYAWAKGLLENAEKTLSAQGLPYLNVYKDLERAGGETLFFDFCHPTAEGYSVVAQTLNRKWNKIIEH